ncbi:MAG TPA: hypothetical protein VFX12_00225 [Vicinamibacterales bacterium]|nr:hypothetical protein [Vicinamibacterales bacterium]
MPPRGVKSPKRKRQYEHIKESEKGEGRSTKAAERIAAATVNKQRSEAGETKKSRGGRKSSSRKSSGSKTSGRKTSGRKTSRKKR